MAAFLHAADGNGLALIDVGLDMLLDAIIAEGMITVKSLHIFRAYGLVADLASYHPALGTSFSESYHRLLEKPRSPTVIILRVLQ